MDFKARMRAFVADDSGQDLLEYALLVGLIALVAVLAGATLVLYTRLARLRAEQPAK